MEAEFRSSRETGGDGQPCVPDTSWRTHAYPRPVPDFNLVAPFEATGDQPDAITKLVDGVERGQRHQTLLGATGTGKTFTMAKVIEKANRPTLMIAHNKTLAAQLYAEFREFFPDNAVEYFVSYSTTTSPRRPAAERHLHREGLEPQRRDRPLAACGDPALFERRDMIIVASVSSSTGRRTRRLRRDRASPRRRQDRRDAVLRHLVDLQYQRNDQALTRARFRVRGDTLELQPASRTALSGSSSSETRSSGSRSWIR